MRKIMKRKMVVAAIAAVSCVSIAGSALAFNKKYSYNIEPKELKLIADFVPNESTIYLNTQPTSGGGVTIFLSEATTGSFSFPAAVSVPDWKVTVNHPNKKLYVSGQEATTGAKGVLNIWSK